jgi:hypothetical protein
MKRATPLLVAVLVVCPLAAQKPIAPPAETPIPEASSRLASSQHLIVVQGCIRGKRLRNPQSLNSEVEFETLRASEFILEGPRELMRQLQEQHDKHFDEIEGVVTVPPSPHGGSTSVTTKKVGPVRVGVGTHEESAPVIVDARRPLTLKVRTLTHLSERCVERR